MRGRPDPKAWLPALGRGVVAPLLLVLVPVGAWMAFYDFRVTGNAFVMPYIVHERQYAAASAFFWVKPRPPAVYHHAVMRQFWLHWDFDRKAFQRKYFVFTRLPFYASIEDFYLGVPLFLAVLFCAPAVARSRRGRLAFWMLVLFLGGVGVNVEFTPHYAAPATALFYIVAASALRLLRRLRPQKAWKEFALGFAMVIVALQVTASAFQADHRFLYDKRDFQVERAQVLSSLNKFSQKQLVIVRYGPKHDIHHEWVYNRANIDASAIVWARSMSPEKDQALISYFKDRRVWLLDENGPAAHLSPYAATAREASTVASP
jgi:hypothetical protein